MIKQLAHLCIHTKDLAATSHFYCDILGLERGFDFTKEGELFGFYLKLGRNTFIEVFTGDPGPEGNIKHVAFEVERLDNLIFKLRAHGVDVKDKQLGGDHAWQTWISDPNGVRIELHEYTATSLQKVGGTVRW